MKTIFFSCLLSLLGGLRLYSGTAVSVVIPSVEDVQMLSVCEAGMSCDDCQTYAMGTKRTPCWVKINHNAVLGEQGYSMIAARARLANIDAECDLCYEHDALIVAAFDALLHVRTDDVDEVKRDFNKLVTTGKIFKAMGEVIKFFYTVCINIVLDEMRLTGRSIFDTVYNDERIQFLMSHINAAVLDCLVPVKERRQLSIESAETYAVAFAQKEGLSAESLEMLKRVIAMNFLPLQKITDVAGGGELLRHREGPQWQDVAASAKTELGSLDLQARLVMLGIAQNRSRASSRASGSSASVYCSEDEF